MGSRLGPPLFEHEFDKLSNHGGVKRNGRLRRPFFCWNDYCLGHRRAPLFCPPAPRAVLAPFGPMLGRGFFWPTARPARTSRIARRGGTLQREPNNALDLG